MILLCVSQLKTRMNTTYDELLSIHAPWIGLRLSLALGSLAVTFFIRFVSVCRFFFFYLPKVSTMLKANKCIYFHISFIGFVRVHTFLSRVGSMQDEYVDAWAHFSYMDYFYFKFFVNECAGAHGMESKNRIYYINIQAFALTRNRLSCSLCDASSWWVLSVPVLHSFESLIRSHFGAHFPAHLYSEAKLKCAWLRCDGAHMSKKKKKEMGNQPEYSYSAIISTKKCIYNVCILFCWSWKKKQNKKH